jgi:transposase
VEQRDRRELTRYRTKLVQERTREINRGQGILERGNIKVASVASDLMGASGRAILVALIEGEPIQPPWRTWPQAACGARSRCWSKR